MSLRAAAGKEGKKKEKKNDRQWQNRIKEPSVVEEKKKKKERLPATGSVSVRKCGAGVWERSRTR